MLSRSLEMNVQSSNFRVNLGEKKVQRFVTRVIDRCFEHQQCNVMVILAIHIVRVNDYLANGMVDGCWCAKSGISAIRIGACIVVSYSDR